jgi:hypothetical protein
MPSLSEYELPQPTKFQPNIAIRVKKVRPQIKARLVRAGRPARGASPIERASARGALFAGARLGGRWRGRRRGRRAASVFQRFSVFCFPRRRPRRLAAGEVPGAEEGCPENCPRVCPELPKGLPRILRPPRFQPAESDSCEPRPTFARP